MVVYAENLTLKLANKARTTLTYILGPGSCYSDKHHAKTMVLVGCSPTMQHCYKASSSMLLLNAKKCKIVKICLVDLQLTFKKIHWFFGNFFSVG